MRLHSLLNSGPPRRAAALLLLAMLSICAIAGLATNPLMTGSEPGWLPMLRESCPNRTIAFVHINKAGGTSVSRVLNEYGEVLNRDPPRDRHPAVLKLPPFASLHHNTAEKYMFEVGRTRWEYVFSFAVVRDPCARMVSPFHFKLKKNLACEKWNAKKEGQEKKACEQQHRVA